MEKKVKKKEGSPPVELSKEEVWDVLKFAQNMVNPYLTGAITPIMLANAMKNVSFMPTELTEDELTRALKDPKNNEDILRSYMEHLEVVSMPLKRIIAYMTSHLAFDLTYTAKKISKGLTEEKDYQSPAFKKDKWAFYEFLDRFDYHRELRKATRQILRNEAFFFAPRDDGDKIVLQELPYDRCLITGRWDFGFLISFDFSYFLEVGVDIRFYPRWFQEKYKEILENQEGYNPSMNLNKRGGYGSNFSYWSDVPPEVAMAFKLDESLATSIPFFSALAPDLMNQSVMRSLQKNEDMASASKMVFGEVPFIKDGKQAVKDKFAISPEPLGKFLALIQSSISTAVKVASAPLENIQGVEFKRDGSIYDDYLRTTSSASGLNSALFFNSDLKANAIETQLSFESDSKIVENFLYKQFDGFMEWMANKTTSKFYFVPKFEGNDYSLDRTRRLGEAKDLAVSLGIVLPQKIAAAKGMKPQEIERMMTQAKAEGFVENLTPITPAFQQSGDAGRPQKKDGELGEKGAETRGQGSNLERGGNV